MGLPLAYFLTWTCYGQRLPGDERGWVDRHHNERGTPYLGPDPWREEAAGNAMTGEPVTLSEEMRLVTDRSIDSLCEERHWRLVTRNVRPTHTHVIVNCRGTITPDRAMAQLKGRATRDLCDAGLARPGAPVWTRGGSKRWINHEAGLYGAIVYVNEWQSGPNREILEEHKRAIRAQMAALREWLKSQGLPGDGRTVVIGESAEERARRVARPRALRSRIPPDEPRAK